MQKIEANPSLAIVIPVYNEAQVLPDALTALGGLSMGSSDCIVFIDGGSTDQSRALIEAGGFRCITSAPGRAKQMNTGMKNTHSDIILYLHIDTSISSCNISNIKKSYKQGYISGRFDISLSNSSVTHRIISFFINMRSRMTKIATGDQGMFVRRDILSKIGGFRDIPLMEDIELSSRLRRLGKVACLRDKLVTSSRRWEDHGIFRTVYLMWKLRFLYWLGVSPQKLTKMYRAPR